MVVKTTTASGDATVTYTYDELNRMAAVCSADGQAAIRLDFQYTLTGTRSPGGPRAR